MDPTCSSLPPPLPKAPFTFSILVSSPIRCNLPFSPVSALILPLASVDIRFGVILVAGIDILIEFLFKRSLVRTPSVPSSPDGRSVTITFDQLSDLMKAASEGRLPLPGPSRPSIQRPGQNQGSGQGSGPVGQDQPLFPDNLSINLSLSSAFALFDGSPDTSFNVPLFEVPGVPGSMIIALGIFIAQFFVERTGIKVPNHQVPVPSTDSVPSTNSVPDP